MLRGRPSAEILTWSTSYAGAKIGSVLLLVCMHAYKPCMQLVASLLKHPMLKIKDLQRGRENAR